MEIWNLICHCECSEAECGNLDILLNLTGTNEIASLCLLVNLAVFTWFKDILQGVNHLKWFNRG
jgi:hypothetical protein